MNYVILELFLITNIIIFAYSLIISNKEKKTNYERELMFLNIAFTLFYLKILYDYLDFSYFIIFTVINISFSYLLFYIQVNFQNKNIEFFFEKFSILNILFFLIYSIGSILLTLI